MACLFLSHPYPKILMLLSVRFMCQQMKWGSKARANKSTTPRTALKEELPWLGFEPTLLSRQVLYYWATRATQLVGIQILNTIQHKANLGSHCVYTLTQYVGAVSPTFGTYHNSKFSLERGVRNRRPHKKLNGFIPHPSVKYSSNAVLRT